MTYTGPHTYTLFIHGPKNKRRISHKTQNGKATNFTKPLTTNKLPKVYLITQGNEVLYVGYASQSVGLRLGQGFRGIGNYHGYKWRHENEVQLHVFVFNQPLTGNRDEDANYILHVEAIEAELVYLVHHQTGQWPLYQNEIHFNNTNRETTLKVAAEILNALQL